jgi:hypothetical protein
MTETAQAAIARHFADDLAQGYRIAGCHRYNAADGTELFRVVRLKHANGDKVIKPMYRDGFRYRMGRGTRPGSGWPLYVPPFPLVEAGPVYVVEGEACADALARLGITATTSGSSSSAGAADWTPLQGRSVRIWPDNDAAGAKYAEAVASRLRAIGCAVQCLDVSALGVHEGGGDCVDWLALHPEATADAVHGLAVTKVVESRNGEGPRVILRRGCDVEPVAVDWLWDGWIAAGKLHLIGGAPGTGKTTIATAIAATVTTGGRWPDGSRAEAGDVVIWSGEDDNADTINPRLRAAGADMRRVHVVGGVVEEGKAYPFDPARDMDALRDALRQLPGVRLIVIDPVVSAVAGDSHKNAEVRRGLQPLVDMAGEIRCALLGVTHFSKGTGGRDPVERITGSLAFAALARLVMVTAKQDADGDRPERRVIMRAKSNIGPDGGGFVYDLQQVPLDGYPDVSASLALWGEAIEGSARELLAEAEAVEGGRSATDEAMDWLRDTLAGGPMPAGEVQKLARQSGVPDKALRTARERLRIKPKRDGFGKGSRMIWALPAPIAAHTLHKCPLPEWAPMGADGIYGPDDGIEVAEI